MGEDFAGSATIEVRIEPRANGRPICSGCRRVGPSDDRLPERRFEFIPLWAIPVCFLYALRRVNCPPCGVKVEEVPWGDGKCTLTRSYRWFLAGWGEAPARRGEKPHPSPLPEYQEREPSVVSGLSG